MRTVLLQLYTTIARSILGPHFSAFQQPIALRNIIPFSGFVLIFTGIGQVIQHYAWFGILWTTVLICCTLYWLRLNVQNKSAYSLDQLGLVQFYLLLTNLVFCVLSDQVLISTFYFFLVVLIVFSFSRRTIQLALMELAVVIFYQSTFLVYHTSPYDLFQSTLVAATIGVFGFLLSYLRPMEETLPGIELGQDHGLVRGASTIQEISSLFPHKQVDHQLLQVEHAEEAVARIKQILDMVHDIVSPYNVLYFELKRDQGYLAPLTWIGNTDYLRTDITIDVGKGPIGWAAKNLMPFHWNRSLGESDPVYYKQRIGIQSLLAIPVSDGHLLAGVLVIDSREPNAFSDKDQKVMEVFARQVALMFEIQNLAYSKHLEAEELKVLHQTGNRLIKMLRMEEFLQEIMEHLKGITRFQTGLILLYNKLNDKLEVKMVTDEVLNSLQDQSFDLMEGLAGWVFQNQKEPIIFAEAQKVLANQPLLGYGEPEIDAQSLLFLPLYSSTRTLGVVLLISPEEQSFRGITGHLLSILANQYSLSLLNTEMYQQLEQLALTDGLTQLINHRHFQEVLTTEFKRFQRDPMPLSLIMVDIDHFKNFNDRYGHPVGDQVLRKVAQILQESCREIDFVAHYGGEEFAILLTNTDKEGAMVIAERIRQTVAQEPFLIENEPLSVTVSLGTATAPDDCQEKHQLIDLADEALYKAKSAGRNKVVQVESS